jgi:hypothetical protein
MGVRARPVLDPVTALRRRAARLLWAEILVHALAPPAFLILAYLTAALFGLTTPWLFAAVLLVTLLSLAYGLATARPPAQHAIDRRIEAASGLKHRPLATLEDEPEDDNPIAAALWQAHRNRILATLSTARIGPPAASAAFRDPWALRSLLASLLLIGLVISGPAVPTRLTGAFLLPAWPFPGPTVTAWITPPSYTGQPPQILQPGDTVTALPGAKLTIITDGPRQAPPITLAGAAIASAALSDSSHRADTTLQTSGNWPLGGSAALSVGPWWHRLARWTIQIVPPGAPVITITGLAISNGNHVRLRWHITDPYGVQSVTATIRPDNAPNALVQTFPLAANTGDAAAALDLSTSPFHDLPVSLILTARNLAGATTSLAWNGKLTFAGLALHDPSAIVLDHLRQTLAVDPGTIRLVATNMQRLSMAPPSHITAAADVKLSVLTCAIWLQQTYARPALARMLALVQEMEAGPDFAAQQAMAAADQALTQALQRGLNGQALTAQALQKLLQAMQAALSQHLSAITPSGPHQPGAQTLDTSALDRLAEKIAADEAAGRTEQAAQELHQLQKLLSQLAAAKPMTAAQLARAAAADAAAQAIAQMTQGEATILDHTHQGTATPADQAGLQAQLNATTQSLAKTGMTIPGLGAAGQAMGNAASALTQQDQNGAESQENAAIAGLQKAAAALSAAQSNGYGIGPTSPRPGGITDSDTGPEGGPDDDSTPADLNTTSNPARVIEQQIINQDAAPALPPATHDYYNRLLQDGAGQ